MIHNQFDQYTTNVWPNIQLIWAQNTSRDHAGSNQITGQYCPTQQRCGHTLTADARAEQDTAQLSN